MFKQSIYKLSFIHSIIENNICWRRGKKMAVINLLGGRGWGKYFLIFNAANFYQVGSIVRYLSLRDTFTAARWLNAPGSESPYNSPGDWTLILMYWHKCWNITSSELWMPLSGIRRWTAASWIITTHVSDTHYPHRVKHPLVPPVPLNISPQCVLSTDEGEKEGGEKDDDSTG